MSGHFDKEEWDFECKRDDRAAKEAELRANWTEWVAKRLSGNSVYDERLRTFANNACNDAIKALK